MQKGKGKIKGEEKKKIKQEQINISKYPSMFERCESWIHGRGSTGKKRSGSSNGVRVVAGTVLHLGPQNALMSSLRSENPAVGLVTFEP